MSKEIQENILAVLQGSSYNLLEHAHVHTSADAATTRGTKLEEAVKALVLEAKFIDRSEYILCAVSGHRRLDLKKIKVLVGCRNISLAHPDDVFRETGCKVGTVSPWPVVFNLRGFADARILEQEYVVFSLASHTLSARMKSQDWFNLAGVEVADIGRISM